ncbi:MAG TPA: hypothetical protein VK985_09525 [Rariglobus sp.]|nr:hypothetical protein [Rariglobus sp.]
MSDDIIVISVKRSTLLVLLVGLLCVGCYMLGLVHGRRSNTFAAAAYGSPAGRADSTVVPVRENLTRVSMRGSNQSACGSVNHEDACAPCRRESNKAAVNSATLPAPTAQFPGTR